MGIVRVSGRGLAGFVQDLLGRSLPPRVATYLPFTDADGQTLDKGLALWFEAPHSYTGEDVVEIQGHGGPVTARRILRRVLDAGARMAELGEGVTCFLP